MDQHTQNPNSFKNELNPEVIRKAQDSFDLDKFDNDDFDLEFRPITNGLGFRDTEEKKKDFIKKKALNRLNEKKNTVLKSSVENSTRSFNRGDLQAFYEKSDPQDFSLDKLLGKEIDATPDLTEEKQVKTSLEAISETPEKINSTINSPTEAAFSFRVFAYLTDLIIVTCTWVLTLVLFSFIAEVGSEIYLMKPLPIDLLAMTGILYLCYYVFYFTFMDTTKSSSIGKALVNINVRNLEGERASVLRTFLRSILSILNTLLLGLPSLFGALDKITGTKVLRSDAY